MAADSYGLIRDTGSILLDMNPDRHLRANLRGALERDGDQLQDLHIWRVDPGHLAALIALATCNPRSPEYYRQKLANYKILSHVTVEVVPTAQ